MPLPDLILGASINDLYTATYKTSSAKRLFYRTCDRLEDDQGNAFAFAVDGNGFDMVPKHAREDTARWDVRRSLACPTSYTRQIVDHYVAHVMRTPPQRQTVAGQPAPPQWKDLLDNADGLGTPLAEVLRQGVRTAFLERECYLLLDLVQNTLAPQSKADQASARYIVRVVPADDVIVCLRSIGGRILAAIIRLPGPDGLPILWRVDGTTGQRVLIDKDDRIAAIEPATVHGLPRCPLVPLDQLPAIIPPVCEAQKTITRTDSYRRYRQGEDSMPWIVVTGTQNATAFVSAMEKNPAFSAFEDKDAKAMNIGANTDVAESLRKDIADDEERLYRTAKVRPVTAQSGNPESGVAHAFRFIDADVELATVAASVERAENEIAAIWAEAIGISDAPKATYPRTFVPVDRMGELDAVSRVSASTLPEPIKYREYQRTASLLYPDDKDISEELADGRAVDPGTTDGLASGADGDQTPAT